MPPFGFAIVSCHPEICRTVTALMICEVPELTTTVKIVTCHSLNLRDSENVY